MEDLLRRTCEIADAALKQNNLQEMLDVLSPRLACLMQAGQCVINLTGSGEGFHGGPPQNADRAAGSSLSLPLLAGEQRLGTITWVFSGARQPWTGPEKQHWEQAIAPVALALQAMLLREEERRGFLRREPRQPAAMPLTGSPPSAAPASTELNTAPPATALPPVAGPVLDSQLKSEQKQARFYQMLNQITHLALLSQDLKELLGVLAKETATALNALGCYVVVWNDQQELPYPATIYGSFSNQSLRRLVVQEQPLISQAIRETDRVVLIENVSQSPFADLARPLTQTTHAIFGLPLKVGSQKLGALLVEYEKYPNGFPEIERRNWQEIAWQASLAVQKLVLFEQERQRRREAETLQQVSMIIAESDDLAKILEALMEGLHKVIHFELGGLARYLGDGKMQTLAMYPKSMPDPFEQAPFLAQLSLSQPSIDSKEPLIFDDAQIDPGPAIPVISRYPEYHGVLYTLLIARGEVIGAVILASRATGHFTKRHAALLQAFADKAGIALENDRLARLSVRQAKHLQILNDIARLAMESQSLAGLLNSVAQYFVEHLAARSCSISLWDNEARRGIPTTVCGADSQAYLGHNTTHGMDLLIEQLNEGGAPVYYDDLAAGPAGILPASQGQPTSLLALPLFIREKKLGAVFLFYAKTDPNIHLTGLEEWGKVAAQLSLAVHKALLFDQEKQRRSEAENLQSAMAGVTASLDLQEVLNNILIKLSRVVAMDGASLHLVKDALLLTNAQLEPDPGRPAGEGLQMPAPVEMGFLKLLRNASTIVVVEDVQNHPLYTGQVRELLPDVKIWVGAPLIGRSGLVGYLVIVRKEPAAHKPAAHKPPAHKPAAFSESDLRFIQTFASQAVVAIENAQLFEQVLQGRERFQNISRKLVDVQEAEKRLLAHELHDEIGQQLTSLIYGMERISRGSDESLQPVVKKMQDQIRSLMDDIREMSIRLRPTVLDDLGLKAGLAWFFRRYREQTGIEVKAVFELVDQRFDPIIETTAFRVVQEALTNVARYAGVGEVAVYAGFNEGHLVVKISDQGKGFDINILNNQEHSFGIAGMEERTQFIGGRFEIFSEIGKGTNVQAVLPVDRPVERRENERENRFG